MTEIDDGKKIALKEIDIDKIKIIENLRSDLGDLSELMGSIKQNGLLEPIGVWEENNHYILSYGSRRLQAFKKLGYKTIPALVSDKKLSEDEFVITNTIENIQRKDITPIELGRMCVRLKELGLSNSEIASRLSLTKGKVDKSVDTFKGVPEKYRSSVGFLQGATNKRGKLSATISQTIVNSRSSKEAKEKMFELAKREELSVKQISLLVHMMYAGMTFEQAKKEIGKYRLISPKFIVDIEEERKIKQKYKKGLSAIIIDMLSGKIPLEKNLFVKNIK